MSPENPAAFEAKKPVSSVFIVERRLSMRWFSVCVMLVTLPLMAGVVIDEDFSVDPTADWSLNDGSGAGGAGPAYNDTEEWVDLTPALNNSGGTLIYKTPVTLQGEFTVEFDFFIGSTTDTCGTHGADGMTFFVMDAAAGTDFVGVAGGGLCLTGTSVTLTPIQLASDGMNLCISP